MIDLPGERWLPWADDPRYLVSSMGRVQRVTAEHGTHAGRQRRPTLHRDSGNLALTFSRVVDGRRKARTVYVARLVLTTFGRAPGAGEEAKYRNGNRRDCRLANLYWSGDSTVRLLSHRCVACGQIMAPARRGVKRHCAQDENGGACWAKRHREKCRAWWRAHRSVAARKAA